MPTLTGTVLSTINVQAVGYDFDTNSPLCFTRGVLIETLDGPRAIETLKVGDLVLTKDNGAKPIAWIGHRSIGARVLAQKPELAPIRIKAGALGKGIPEADLIVSPQHRMLIGGPTAQALFNAPEVLVRAEDLVNDASVAVDFSLTEVTYIHILLERHNIVFANGVETESFHPSNTALDMVQRIPGFSAIDGDGMGRAYPELQMVTFTMHGVSATPMVLCDDKGNSLVLDTVSNAWTERLARALTIEMGGSAMVGLNFGLGVFYSYLFLREKPTRGRLLFFVFS